jgi:putative membrane protein
MKDKSENTGLRPTVHIPVNEEEKTEPATLRPAIKIENAEFDPSATLAPEQTDDQLSAPGKLFWFLVLLVLMAITQLAVSLYGAFQTGAWLGVAWLTLLALGGMAMGVALVREWRAFTRLEQRAQWQQTSARLAQSPAIGEAREYCLQLAKQLPDAVQQDVASWLSHLQPHYSDKEMIALFEQQVLSSIDKQVVNQISHEASASAVLIAVSPFALLDMLLVLWRNLKMINQISRSYGIYTGYWARIKLIRKMCHNIIYAGASELAADASVWALGGSLTARLSGRAAQGLGAGVLTARMGVQAARLCRPMPFIQFPAPSTGKIASQVLNKLKKMQPDSGAGHKADSE